MPENAHGEGTQYQETPHPRRLSIGPIMCLIMLCWTGTFAVSLWYSVGELEKHAMHYARIQARTAFEKDVTYRRWNSMMNGVMAPIVPGVLEPNPYLPAAGRDITTTDGVSYTKINPAFMTRLVHELGAMESGVIGHITSNMPIRKGNEPDPWEGAALKQLEAGLADEISGIEAINGAPYMRLIRPLVVEESCLPCHQFQGYTLNQVRGGISVSVPMKPITASMQNEQHRQAFAHGGLWGLGMAVIGGTMFRLSRSMKEHERDAELLRKEVAQRIEAETQLRLTAGTDMLTQLPNRRTALERLDMEIVRYKRSKAVFSLLLVDLDHFKNVNDTWGHEAGDKTLVVIAARLKSLLRGQDTVARWGGEEFLIILSETPEKSALIVAEKLRAGVEAVPVDIGTEQITLTASIGVAEFHPGRDVAFSIKIADDALYNAKKSGRNRVELARG
ncbi:MAG: diguanylate cyclase [Desulfovibrionaceae bacterium]|nr:diguanylate cyclase [Desulfovibrionaceae bacterium]